MRKVQIANSKWQIRKDSICGQAGFTLIELMIVFSSIALLTTLGVASYVTYDQSQKLRNAVAAVAIELQTAKSRAQAQYKPDTSPCNDPNIPLRGYWVGFDPVAKAYSMRAVCTTTAVITSGVAASDTYTVLFEKPSLPAGMKYGSATNTPGIFFEVLTGNTNLNTSGGVDATIAVTTDDTPANTKTITVDNAGNITSN